MENSLIRFRGDSGMNDGKSNEKDLDFDGAYTVSLLSWTVIEYHEKYEDIGEIDHMDMVTPIIELHRSLGMVNDVIVQKGVNGSIQEGKIQIPSWEQWLHDQIRIYDVFSDKRSKPWFTEPSIASNAGLVAALVALHDPPTASSFRKFRNRQA
ncbi:hypothetical protein H5410_023472, partial [Solanum commersonii]